MSHLVLSHHEIRGKPAIRIVSTDSVAALQKALLAEYEGPSTPPVVFYGSGPYRDRLAADIALKRWGLGIKRAKLAPIATRLWSLEGTSFADEVVPWATARLGLYHVDESQGYLLGDVDALDWAALKVGDFCERVHPMRMYLNTSTSKNTAGGREDAQGEEEEEGEDASQKEPWYEFVNAEPMTGMTGGSSGYVVGREHLMALIATYYCSFPYDTVASEPWAAVEHKDNEKEAVARRLDPETSGSAGLVVPSPRITEHQAQRILSLFFSSRGSMFEIMSGCRTFLAASMRCSIGVAATVTGAIPGRAYGARGSPGRSRTLGFACVFEGADEGASGVCVNDISEKTGPTQLTWHQSSTKTTADPAKPTDKPRQPMAVVRNQLTGRVSVVAPGASALIPELETVGTVGADAAPLMGRLLEALCEHLIERDDARPETVERATERWEESRHYPHVARTDGFPPWKERNQGHGDVPAGTDGGVGVVRQVARVLGALFERLDPAPATDAGSGPAPASAPAPAAGSSIGINCTKSKKNASHDLRNESRIPRIPVSIWCNSTNDAEDATAPSRDPLLI